MKELSGKTRGSIIFNTTNAIGDQFLMGHLYQVQDSLHT